MIVELAGAATATVLVAWLEGKPSTWHLGAIAFLLVFSSVHLIVPVRMGALSIAIFIAGAIGVLSKAKFRFLGTNLVAGDFSHLTANTIALLRADYAPLNARVLALLLAGGAGAGLVLGLLSEPPVPLKWRGLFFCLSALAGVAAFVGERQRRRFRTQTLTQDRAHLSLFFASLIGAGPSRVPTLAQLADKALPLVEFSSPPISGASRRPHIIMILHESTFDPAQAALPSDERFEEFFRPAGGAAGVLAVDIFGGGTWQTEFSVFAGMSSLCFGPDAQFVFQALAGRVRHSLPAFLAGLGYQTALVTSDEVPSASHRRFYRSIGFQRIEDPAELPVPFDIADWKRSHRDAPIYDHALRSARQDLADGRPMFLSLATLFNHGPHSRRRRSGSGYDAFRKAGFERTGNAAFGEYLARLAESVDDYKRFRASLAELLDGAPALLVRFGDHQPSFMAGLTGLAPPDPRLRQTFFAFEPVNMDLPTGFAVPKLVDAAYLSTLTVALAGLPPDPVFATRKTLMDECPTSYFDCHTPLPDRFHRTLVDKGLLDLS